MAPPPEVAPPPEIIDWGLAARIGKAIGGAGPATTPGFREAFRDDLLRFSTLSDELVGDFTGLTPEAGASQPAILSRAGWVRANLDGFRALLQPVTDQLAERVPVSPIPRRVAAAGLGVQIGILLGYLSKKVLGQYDLVLAASDDGSGQVYYVAPNIVSIEQRLGLDPDDFRLWIALHEVTHRTQFAAVPWLRNKATEMMRSSLASFDLDPERVKALIAKGRELLLGGPAAWKSATVMDLIVNDEQRAVMMEMQSLMTIVEGHGTFVMNRVGAERIPSFPRLRAALHGNRKDIGGAEKVFQRAIGLDVKLAQYEIGERFMDAVADIGGTDAVNRVWDREENLPTPDELRDAQAWLARIGP